MLVLVLVVMVTIMVMAVAMVVVVVIVVIVVMVVIVGASHGRLGRSMCVPIRVLNVRSNMRIKCAY